MDDYVTDDVRVLLDEAVEKALAAGTEWEVFERVVQERWQTYSSLRRGHESRDEVNSKVNEIMLLARAFANSWTEHPKDRTQEGMGSYRKLQAAITKLVEGRL